jgi:copper(I)-binding protein
VFASNIVVTAPAPGMPMAAAYLDITNQSGSAIRITSVTSPDYELVEMHETTIEDGVARMRAIPALAIENGETVTFERGGRHLMLMRPLDSPDIVTLNFHSENLLLLSVSAQFTAMTD